jgi:hypothetical protein
MTSATHSTVRPQPDQVLVDIADYVADYAIESSAAFAGSISTTPGSPPNGATRPTTLAAS